MNESDVRQALANPDLVFILFTIGFMGLLLELVHPNFLTGIVGILALILAFIGSGNLPVNVAGLALLALSVALLFAEAYVTSHGILAIAGLIFYVIGAVIFYSAPAPGQPGVRVDWVVIGVTGAILVGFVFIVVRAAFRLRRMKPTLVSPGLSGSGIGTIGQVGEVRTDLAPAGSIYVAGEEWSARTNDGAVVRRGLPVKVVAQDGLMLIVEPVG